MIAPAYSTTPLSKQKTPALQTGVFQNLCFSRARNPKGLRKCLYRQKPELATPHNFNHFPLMAAKRFTSRNRQQVKGSQFIGLLVGMTLAKHKKKFKQITNPDERFTQISRGYMKGEAWLALSDTARVLLIYMRTLYNKNNNGQINMSARYGGKILNRAKTTVYRALVDLTAKGFIIPHKPGSMGINGSGVATSWELTDFGMDGKPAKYLYKKFRQGPKKKPSKGKTTDGKNKTPYSNRTHSNSDLNPLEANSGFESYTGGFNLHTVKGVNDPTSGFKSHTYIQDIPLPTPNNINPYLNPLENFSPTDQQSQIKLVDKIGSDGWGILVALPLATVQSLTDKNDAGLLTTSEIENLRLEASQTNKRFAQ